ncbi:SDR family oxidoreductase [Streptomyces acidiscabies]|uniref:SDR family NAD(P)-dependent oxidoreductase n=2 Tax=Streptomyces acidiscabies TaxID=42234 RepID=A0AAP6BLP5_9ACTN|nr:SDR family NAD(P)-dependent oxidoreductase [Streptomyces acidiscabies]MBP5942119.1 SDR family NAD(P)-dependent oxidoreductase [Streptomyces sp. LBUM 1476]MBZ3913628.1 SDR family NAD(P)-dependent oxidoreductase [Streptomyces acidiscabies]MDX2967091.1 SDR family NAD(P)-dependent oxidoreductase [Streptomyces acidiscabies]MDX3023197.1 SDR family NAD(P)-dependent oxidoreductase [Streptomyces acidiscabies]MDX3792657.1 SDR family NAD(P)-dependent oxidoreductase [Streptomyces acidiscabies]
MRHISDQGRAILVTGAANGIGAAVAERAIALGHRVMLTDVDEDAVLARARALGPRTAACALDIRSAEGWRTAFETAEAAFGVVDVLVNNAGITHTGHARDLSPRQHRDIVEINLLGTITGVCTALERMTAQGHGHIINVCSMTSFLPLPGYATYCGTKHGLRAFHHSVAIEERDGPLDFTIIHPPSTRTGMLDQEMDDPSCAISFAEKSYAPEQIAEAVVDAVAAKPAEVVFPPLAGRVQRIAGVFPRLMRRVIPLAEARGLRQREKLLTARSAS